MDKRGQGISTNAIVLIILAVVVLVILIIGFTVGWSKMAPWISTDNVDVIVNQCSIACSTDSVFGYCTQERELKFGETIEGLTSGQKYTCDELSGYAQLGVEECPAVTCPE